MISVHQQIHQDRYIYCDGNKAMATVQGWLAAQAWLHASIPWIVYTQLLVHCYNSCLVLRGSKIAWQSQGPLYPPTDHPSKQPCAWETSYTGYSHTLIMTTWTVSHGPVVVSFSGV